MNPNNRLQKLEAKLTNEDYCKCFAEQTRNFVNKIYAGAAYSIEDNPTVPTRSGVCSVCHKPIQNIFDAQTIETINELYEEAAR